MLLLGEAARCGVVGWLASSGAEGAFSPSATIII